MTVRTYRIQVTGYFDRPEEAVRQRLLQQQPEHDVVNSAFCPEGSFSYTPTLTRFTFRYLLSVDEDAREEADSVAAFEGETISHTITIDSASMTSSSKSIL